jgi:hypothetical protein
MNLDKLSAVLKKWWNIEKFKSGLYFAKSSKKRYTNHFQKGRNVIRQRFVFPKKMGNVCNDPQRGQPATTNQNT